MAEVADRVKELEERLARWEGEEGLHQIVRDLIEEGPDWPSHGNAPLAIASLLALQQMRIDALRKAITDTGPYPAIHDDIHHRHRKEWPTLWRAIDHLLR